jgi:hypothetical protein
MAPSYSRAVLIISVARPMFNEILLCLPGVIFHRGFDNGDAAAHAPPGW